jgi:glycosyltransferase involved in cell wall biosynthesis
MRQILNPRKDRGNFSFAKDIEKVMGKLKPTPNDTILINSLRPNQFLAFIKWIKQHEQIKLPNIIIILHFTSALNNRSGRVFKSEYKEAFGHLRNIIGKNRIRIFADTVELVNEFRELGAPEIFLAPIPVFLTGAPIAENKRTSKTDSKDKITVSFVGQARKDKGFHLLPNIIEVILPYIKLGKASVKIQVNDEVSKDKLNKAIVNQLIGMGCEIIEGNLNPTEYMDLIIGSDIILLPYIGDAYKSQSSGIFAEAMALGKIVVTHEGTWMAKQINKRDASVGETNLHDLKGDLNHYLNNYQSTKPMWDEFSKNWISNQNAIKFTDQILEFSNQSFKNLSDDGTQISTGMTFSSQIITDL